MTWLTAFLDWALHSSDELTMPRTWLANAERMAFYEAWTARENASAYVSKDVAAMKRDAFWANLEARKQQPTPRPKVVSGRFQ